MGRSEFQEEIQRLQGWRLKYKPILFVPAANEAWESIWGMLEQLSVPTSQVWVNYDDGDGACYLSIFEDAPPLGNVAYLALYVTEEKFNETSSIFPLTDQDIECETCSGSDEDCETCNGTGIEWLELADINGISTDPAVLTKYFAP